MLKVILTMAEVQDRVKDFPPEVIERLTPYVTF